MARRFLPDFDKGAHSVYLEYFHIIIVTKYRHQFINEHIANDIIKKNFEYVGKKYYVKLESFGWEADHVHFMVTASPRTDFSKFLCQFKSFSSRIIREAFPKLARHRAFWSPSYCLLTSGGAPIDIIKKYVESQKGGKNEFL